MQVKIEDQSSVKKKLSFMIPKETVIKELDKAYNQLGKSVNIKGFRKGKVPRKVLENRFFKDIHAEVASRFIQDSFVESVREHNLKVITSPHIEPPELFADREYSFDMTIEVRPELNDIEYTGIDLKKNKYEVSEGEIQAQLEMVRKTMAKKTTVKEARPVREKDFVLIDYEGFLDGKPYRATPKVENYVMCIGQTSLPIEFSEKLIGSIPVQDLETTVNYAQDFYIEDLRGKSIVYKVTLKEIQEEILPDMDDNFVKQLGDFQNIDDMKTSIRKILEKSYDVRVQQEISEQIFQHLLKKYEFEIPASMVEKELNDIVLEAELSFAQNNKSLEEVGMSREVLKDKYRDVAEDQARRHVLLSKIIEQENLELNDEEVNASFEEMSKRMNISMDEIKKYFQKEPAQLESYTYAKLTKKAIDFIIEKNNVTEIEPETTSSINK